MGEVKPISLRNKKLALRVDTWDHVKFKVVTIDSNGAETEICASTSLEDVLILASLRVAETIRIPLTFE